MTGDFIQRRDRAYRGATRMLTGHGRHTQAEWLRELAGWVEANAGGLDPLPDHYGTGPQVTDLTQEVAALLGKPAAVLMPSGIMAQQAALRAWAERSGRTEGCEIQAGALSVDAVGCRVHLKTGSTLDISPRCKRPRRVHYGYPAAARSSHRPTAVRPNAEPSTMVRPSGSARAARPRCRGQPRCRQSGCLTRSPAR
jgi:hypothetical protein